MKERKTIPYSNDTQLLDQRSNPNLLNYQTWKNVTENVMSEDMW